MATHTFDRGGEDDGAADVSLFKFYGEDYVWTDLTPAVGGFGLTADQARTYAADLITHADALDRRNTIPLLRRPLPGRLDYLANELEAALAKPGPANEDLRTAAAVAVVGLRTLSGEIRPTESATAGPPPPQPRITILVAALRRHCEVWCIDNNRRLRDPTIRWIRSIQDLHRLQGITDFDLVVLSDVEHHDRVMAEINHRMARHGTDRT